MVYCRCELSLLLLILIMCADSASIKRSAESESSRCQGCSTQNKEESDKVRLEIIRQQILEKLRLPEVPNITRPLPKDVLLRALDKIDPQVMADVGEESTNRKPVPSEYYATTREIISFSEPGEQLGSMQGVTFSISHDNPSSLEVITAKLWLLLQHKDIYVAFLKQVFANLNRKVTIDVYRAVNGSSLVDLANVGEKLLKVASVRVPVVHAGWLMIDLPLRPIQQWFDGPLNQKLDLFIRCVDCGVFVQPVVITSEREESENADGSSRTAGIKNVGDNRPFLVMQTKAKPKTEQTRHKRSLDCVDGSEFCCRQPLYVNFTEIGYDQWIIAPSGYNAYHCTGSCNVAFDPEQPIHGQLMQLYRHKNPSSKPEPCCFPKSFSPMSLIYVDKDMNIIKAELPNMIVEECACAH